METVEMQADGSLWWKGREVFLRQHHAVEGDGFRYLGTEIIAESARERRLDAPHYDGAGVPVGGAPLILEELPYFGAVAVVVAPKVRLKPAGADPSGIDSDAAGAGDFHDDLSSFA